jgi:hypothetical protein
VRRVDFRIGHVRAVVEQRFRDLARALGREAPVGGERDDEKSGTGFRQRAGETPVVLESGIEIVERLGDAQIRIRVEVFGKLVRLVAQVRLDLEFGLERIAELAVFELAAEFRRHLVVR